MIDAGIVPQFGFQSLLIDSESIIMAKYCLILDFEMVVIIDFKMVIILTTK